MNKISKISKSLASLRLISKKRGLDLKSPKLMGVLNVTPDSFSDGGQFKSFDKALAYARSMISLGADWLDIGGESSGPGSVEISLDEELSRVMPLIEAIRRESDIWLSIDTWKSGVASEAIDAGVDCVNDVTALRGDPQMAPLISRHGCAVILMYSKDVTARTSLKALNYTDVIQTIREFFRERLEFALGEKIPAEAIMLDPGMGHFVSSNPQYSFEIIRRFAEFGDLDHPMLIGPSRKSFLANVSSGIELASDARDFPCAAVCSIAVWKGAKMLRMHEVGQGRQLLDTLSCIGLPDDDSGPDFEKV